MNADSPEYQRASAAHLKHIFDIVRDYNNQQGAGTRVAAFVSGEAETPFNTQDVQVRLGSTLEVCGLTLQEVQINQTIHTANTSAHITELRTNISSKDAFTRYLNGMDRDALDEEAYRALKWFADQTIEQLVRVYDLNSPSDLQFLDCITSLNVIIARYDELDPSDDHGLKTQAHKIAYYRDAAEKKYLREYITAKNNLLFEKIGTGFNQSTWQIDSSQKLFAEKWRDVTRDVMSMRENPNAQEFFLAIAQHLYKSIDYARKDIRANEDTEFPYLDKPEKLKILDAVEDTLSHI